MPPTPQPHLARAAGPGQPRGLVLMLHGGAETATEPVGRSGPWARSRLMMAQVRHPLRRAGLEVWLLRYRYRGWNDGHEALPSPVLDARWALGRLRAERPRLPVALLGHSMGARTAAAVADDPAVVGVVALAPWFPAGDPVEPLRGKRLAAAHGRADRVTLYDHTEAFVRRAAKVAASAELVDMGEVGHYLLSGMRDWNSFAVCRLVDLLSDAG